VLDGIADRISDFALSILARLSPETAADLADTGMFLCGGACQAAGIAARLAARTRIGIHPLATPHHAVARGLSRVLSG
jgi:actin-like ATPase involved in cell morphogenesis